MSRATQRTKLSLDEWARIMGINPLHFNQVTSAFMPDSLCSNVWKQFAWQEAQMVSREDVALAIYQAESDIELYARYPLVPIWINDERARVMPPGIPEVINIGLTDTGNYPLNVITNQKHFISGGIEAKTLIEAGAAVVYTDMNADGYFETATVIVVTTVTDPAEIAVYYPGEAANDSWEVRPLHDPITRRRSVTIAGGSATIVMAREQLVDPDLMDAFDPSNVPGEDAANFLGTVDVYRHHNDPQTQATLMWSPRPGLCACGTVTCQVCAHQVQTACLVSGDIRRGVVRFSPALWDATTEQFNAASPTVGRSPDALRLFYRAGFQTEEPNAIAPTLEMDTLWARAVAYLSIRYLARPICGCDNVRELQKRMMQDLALNFSDPGGSVSFQINDQIIGNPLGTERGALLAWRTIIGGDRVVGHAVNY